MRQQFVEDFGAKYPWLPAGTLETEQALLGASGLDDASVTALTTAKRVIIKIPEGWGSMEIRFYSNAAADIDDVLQLYSQAYAGGGLKGPGAVDHYRHFAQLTIIVGTQVYGTYKFHDDITPANEAWITPATEVSPGNNTFGSYAFNLHGSEKIVVIASDLDSTLIGVEYRRM